MRRVADWSALSWMPLATCDWYPAMSKLTW